MKRFLIVFLASFICLINIACEKTVYVDSSSGKILAKPALESYIDLQIVYEDSSNSIRVDRNTDVLYYRYYVGYRDGITPIMKADGTCLTYTEWKERNY